MSRFFNEDIANKAINYCLNDIKECIEKTGRSGAHIIVLDPTVPYEHKFFDGIPVGPANSTLAEWSINEAKWGAKPYKRIAWGKAILSLRTGMSTRKVIEKMPHLLLPGDVRYPGGVNYKGVVVAISGLESQDNEKFARQIAERGIWLTRATYREWDEESPGERFV